MNTDYYMTKLEKLDTDILLAEKEFTRLQIMKDCGKQMINDRLTRLVRLWIEIKLMDGDNGVPTIKSNNRMKDITEGLTFFIKNSYHEKTLPKDDFCFYVENAGVLGDEPFVCRYSIKDDEFVDCIKNTSIDDKIYIKELFLSKIKNNSSN